MLRAILGSIDEAIHAVNEKGITIFYNEVAAKHDGLEINEVLGKHILETFPSLTEETSTLLKVIRTKEPIYHIQQTYKNKRGTFIDTINTTLPIKVGDRLIGAVEIAKDYSQIKTLSNKLLDLQSKIKAIPKKPNEVTGTTYSFQDIITRSEEFMKIKHFAERISRFSSSVLVYGETGTGKELLVQSIHNSSSRNLSPFIVQNCAALPESLLESLLFGTVKGSYTGAVDRAGLFELAHGGTLFLDEINSMPLQLQSKLLRVLEDGVVRRIGATKAYQVDVRVIVAMNESPLHCVERKQLREDLYYRLNVYPLEIPPLRERKEDIPLLMDFFISKYSESFKRNIPFVDDNVKDCLLDYSWPGNVRELKHCIEHAMSLVDGEKITISHLPPHLTNTKKTLSASNEKSSSLLPLRSAVEETEKKLIRLSLEQTGGNILQAAKLLKIPRQTLQYKIDKYQMSSCR
ncbi:sigma 54-interacting transcriptional regulator [Bacillus timonensis]|nr:sigma 54-interacting transcriptional regulator [Bacillus timonensis]